MKYTLFITAFIALFSLGNAVLNSGVVMDSGSNFKVQWEIQSDTIIFAVSANVQGWIGVGWHCPTCQSDKPMQNADFIVGNFSNYQSGGAVIVQDMYSNLATGKPPPVLDTAQGGVNNIITSGGYQTSDQTFMIFSRLLNTGDNVTDNIIDPSTPLYFIWAYGSGDQFNKHINAGVFTLNLLEDASSQSSGSSGPSLNYVDWHASLMFLAFGILMPFGIFAGRFLKGFDWWFPLHYICQGLAFLCALIAFILIIVFVDGFDFSTIHAIFGIITLSFVVLAVGVGITSHLMWKPNRTATPIFPDIIHHYGGRLTYLLGTATIITGMVLHQIPTPTILVFAGFVAFCWGIVVFLEIYRRKYPQKYDDEIQRLIN